MKKVAISNLHFAYGRRSVFDGINAEFHQGVNFVAGVNGSGKTTLFQLMLGALAAQRGSIIIPGSAGYLPQTFGYPPRFTLAGFVEHFAWLQGVDRGVRHTRALEALDMVGLASRAQDRMSSLSGGMLRRAGIAQALVHRPSVLLLDEPTAGLDPRQRHELHELVQVLAEDIILVFSTHLLDDISALGGNVVLLGERQITFTGSVAHMAAHGADGSLHAAFLELTGDAT